MYYLSFSREMCLSVTTHSPPRTCALVASSEAPVSLLTELRVLMWVEFLLHKLDISTVNSNVYLAHSPSLPLNIPIP